MMHEALTATTFARRQGAKSHPLPWRELDEEARTRRRTSSGNSIPLNSIPLDRDLHELCNQVAQAIAALGYPSLRAVSCEAAADLIVLSGNLPSYHLKQMAQVAALRVAGRRRVDNRVVVTSR
jgi:hypothetical protein